MKHVNYMDQLRFYFEQLADHISIHGLKCFRTPLHENLESSVGPKSTVHCKHHKCKKKKIIWTVTYHIWQERNTRLHILSLYEDIFMKVDRFIRDTILAFFHFFFIENPHDWLNNIL